MVPMPQKKFVKQITGREDKERMKVDLLTPDSSRLMFPTGNVIQRGLTKVEDNKDKEGEDKISLD